MRASENRSDVEAELESEEPTEMGGDASTSKDDGDWGIIATSVEHREPVTMSTGSEREVERHDDVPKPRKRAASSNAVGEWEVKWTRSPRSLEASSALSPPAPGTTG